MRGVDLAQLHLNAVVDVAVGGQDVEAPAPWVAQLLGNDDDLTQPKPRRLGHEPVLQPPLVIAEVAKAGALPAVHRDTLLLTLHGGDSRACRLPIR